MLSKEDYVIEGRFMLSKEDYFSESFSSFKNKSMTLWFDYLQQSEEQEAFP